MEAQDATKATISTAIKAAALVLLAVALGSAGPAQATPIVVENAGFEHDVFPDTGALVGEIFGWAGSGVFGTYNPVAAQFPAGVPEGDHVAFNHETTPLSQVLAAALAGNKTYTLQVDIGSRQDLPSSSYSVGLYAGGILLAEDVSSIALTPGQFSTATVIFAATALEPLIGQALEIRLGSGGSFVNFDNVRLDAVAHTPEPSVALLLGAGLVGLGLRRIRVRG